MAQISRLRDQEISNGNLINADDIDAELNQLVNESNSQDSRLTIVESGNISLDGVKTFLKAPKLGKMVEATLGSGILAESVRLTGGSLVLRARVAVSSVNTSTDELTTAVAHGLSTGQAVLVSTDNTLPPPLVQGTVYYARVVDATTVTLHPTEADATGNTNRIDITGTGTGSHAIESDAPSPSNGQVWYNPAEDHFKARRNGATKKLLLEGDVTAMPKGYLCGPPPAYVSASSVKIPAGFTCRDGDDSVVIAFASDATADITASGANGLDTGSEASGTWYYLWAIADSTGANNPAALLSASSTTPTMPSGYDKKRLLPVAIRNNGSSDFIPFVVTAGWPSLMPFVQFRDAEHTSAYNVLSSGAASSFTAVSLAALVPPVSRNASLNFRTNAVGGGDIYVRPTGSGLTTGIMVAKGASTHNQNNIVQFIHTDASQSIDYRATDSAAVNIHVLGFTVTEVN